MRKHFSKLMAATALLIAALFPAHAAELGDAAGPLAISAWVKGDAVDLAKLRDKKVAVVEFWATWCPPCRASIPHLTELQAKFKDKVAFIGVSTEDEATVRPFVEEQGDAMAYTVAVDDNQKTSNAYMNAYEIGGIPHAFIVDRSGKMVFHAHPMDPMFESALSKVVDGNFDLAAVQAEMKAQKQLEGDYNAYFELAFSGEEREKMGELSAKLLKGFNENSNMLNGFAWGIAATEGLKVRDLDTAHAAAERARTLSDGKDASIMDTYARVLFEQGKHEEAIAAERKAIELASSDREREAMEKQLAMIEKEQANNQGGHILAPEVVPAPDGPQWSATAFMITANGYVVTAAHAVVDATRIVLTRNGEEFLGRVIAKDAANDVAILKTEGTFSAVAVSSSRDVKTGTEVCTVGFPNIVLQGVAPKVTRGYVNSLSGFQDDPRYFQVSAQVQKGNSGGALIDMKGNVIGVVVAKLDPLSSLAVTGSFPQDVNYAIKSSYLLPLIESVPELSRAVRSASVGTHQTPEEAISALEEATYLLLAF